MHAPVSTILTLRILVLPILLISTVFAVIIYLNLTNFDASAILDSISAIVSMILVNLLVWERLRTSLRRKLRYTHKNMLIGLYEQFKNGLIHFYEKGIRETLSDLERYGKFMGIPLYPKGLLKDVDSFLTTYEDFDNRVKKLVNVGKENIDKGFDKYLWLPLLGIEYEKYSHFIKKYEDTPLLRKHTEQVSMVKKDQAELVLETKELYGKCKQMQRGILEKFEDFLKTNNLSFEVEIPRM